MDQQSKNKNIFSKKSWGLSVVEYNRCLVHDWKISNYNNLLKEHGEFLQSPSFSIGSEKPTWILKLYPKGLNGYKDYVGLYLCKSDESNLKFDGWCILSVLDDEGKQFIEYKKKINQEQKYFGEDTFFHEKILTDKICGLLPHNTLSIRCEFVKNCINEHVSINDHDQVGNKKINHFRKLGLFGLENHLFTGCMNDLKLITPCGESVPAMSTILIQCSPVFRKMLGYESGQWIYPVNKEIKLENCNLNAVKEMLRILYRGQVENIISVAVDVVELGKKYRIDKMKEFCEDELNAIMSIDNVLDIVAIAESLDSDFLRERVINFMTGHYLNILDSEKFDKASMTPEVWKNVEIALNNAGCMKDQ